MADLEKAAVSRYPTAVESSEILGGFGMQMGVVTKRLKLVLTGQGGTTNKITAASMGLTKLLDCGNLYDKTNGKIYLAVVDPELNAILLAATAADTVADITTTEARINVTGLY